VHFITIAAQFPSYSLIIINISGGGIRKSGRCPGSDVSLLYQTLMAAVRAIQ
jgi:hypothetical protein